MRTTTLRRMTKMPVSKPRTAERGGRRDERVEGYVGLWFHSFHDDGNIKWQGRILRRVEKDRWAVQLYSWVDGGPSHVEIVDRPQMESFRFYNDHRAMHEGWIATLPARDQEWARRAHKFLNPAAFGTLDE